jgi:hypothetical protein
LIAPAIRLSSLVMSHSTSPPSLLLRTPPHRLPRISTSWTMLLTLCCRLLARHSIYLQVLRPYRCCSPHHLRPPHLRHLLNTRHTRPCQLHHLQFSRHTRSRLLVTWCGPRLLDACATRVPPPATPLGFPVRPCRLVSNRSVPEATFAAAPDTTIRLASWCAPPRFLPRHLLQPCRAPAWSRAHSSCGQSAADGHQGRASASRQCTQLPPCRSSPSRTARLWQIRTGGLPWKMSTMPWIWLIVPQGRMSSSANVSLSTSFT